MLKTAIATAFVLGLGITTAFAQTSGSSGTSAATGSSMKMSQSECQSLWGKADAGKAGSLTQAQAQPYVTDFNAADTNKDGKLTSAEFLSACQQGHVKSSATTGSSTGATGSSSGMSSGSSSTSGSSKMSK